jgi:2-keto-4-pentenoate hydratase/2-oxohepta-3-ene-1,7-dioic acid hydratase in catechol pathway
VGVNYRSHADETGTTLPATPVLFSKFANALAGDGETIPLPYDVYHYDYEVELAVVIGRRAHRVTREAALEYVLGYCVANDVSARDLQFRTNQWLLGKTLDKFLPLGPDLVTADEIADPQALHLRCWVNDDLRQDATTADMVFGVAELIAYVSAVMPLEPGDVLCTGTPEGVVLGRPQQDWLRAGDTVVCEIEGLGRLTNPLIAEVDDRPDAERVYLTESGGREAADRSAASVPRPAAKGAS